MANEKMTEHELVKYYDRCITKQISVHTFKRAIQRYESENGCKAPDYIYERFNRVSQERGVIKLLVVIGIIILICVLSVLSYQVLNGQGSFEV